MTKNYENTDNEKASSSSSSSNMPHPSNSNNQNFPQSPQDQILEFINTLGEHVMDEVLSTTDGLKSDLDGLHLQSDLNEGGQHSRGTTAAPPDYSFTTETKPAEKAGETATHAHRGGADEPAGSSSASASGSAAGSASGDRNNRNSQRGQSQNHGQNQGQNQNQGWGPWGGNWRNNRSQNPWAAMADMFGGGGIPMSGAAPSVPLFDPSNEGFQAGHGPHQHPPPPPHENFPFGGFGGGFGGFGGGRGGGRGGHCHPGGGRGGYYGGPWGWKSRRHWGNRGGADDQDFSPAIDLFDTPESFVVHIALPGALKEDIGINYDFDKSELQISGVVHRPGNEEFLKHLVDGERRVGAFDRKIKLESKGKSVAVDADGITAKLENGLLEVTVPKLRKADEPEKRKIRIE